MRKEFSQMIIDYAEIPDAKVTSLSYPSGYYPTIIIDGLGKLVIDIYGNNVEVYFFCKQMRKYKKISTGFDYELIRIRLKYDVPIFYQFEKEYDDGDTYDWGSKFAPNLKMVKEKIGPFKEYYHSILTKKIKELDSIVKIYNKIENEIKNQFSLHNNDDRSGLRLFLKAAVHSPDYLLYKTYIKNCMALDLSTGFSSLNNFSKFIELSDKEYAQSANIIAETVTTPAPYFYDRIKIIDASILRKKEYIKQHYQPAIDNYSAKEKLADWEQRTLDDCKKSVKKVMVWIDRFNSLKQYVLDNIDFKPTQGDILKAFPYSDSSDVNTIPFFRVAKVKEKEEAYNKALQEINKTQ